jgi:quinoprotein glucose dehydrogenase
MTRLSKRAPSGAFLFAIAAVAFGGLAHAGPKDWPVSGQDAGGQRFSRALQITPSNVARLREEWVYRLRTDSTVEATGGAAETQRYRVSQSIPLVIGDTMYLGSPYGRVLALDATTGREKWAFDLPDDDAPSVRGITYWSGPGGQRSIVFGTRLGRLYSLNARTGKLNAAFGEGGMVNLKTPDVMIDPNSIYILPTQPVVYKNLIITGAGPGEGPGGANARGGARGDTRAWDARTGKLVWTFHTVPRPGEPNYGSWGADSAKDRSGVNVWGYMTVDEARGIVYMPIGAPNNDRVGIDRPGDNLYSSAIVAADANTGKYLWHFQVTRHDIWDYDTQAPPVLMDIEKDGQVIPTVAIVNKNALLFFLNRVTGEPVYPIEQRPVPPSDVPGEVVSPTQAFPVVTPPLAQTSITRSTLFKGVASHQEFCEKLVDDNDMYLSPVTYAPPKLNRYSVSLPGTQGGVNFYGPTYDPDRGLLVVNVNNLAQPMRIVRNPDGSYQNSGPLAGLNRLWDPVRRWPCNATPWGELVAVNVNTGKIAWKTTLGVTDDFPEGLKDTGRPGSGGAITTASGLTFIAATDDARFRAFLTATGEKVWEVKLPASGYATPITYEVRGKQYLAIVATGGVHRSPVASDGLHVFALP